jgi:protein-tyrosine phosphatase
MSCKVSGVEAETDGAGCIVVRWQLDGEDAVNIGLGRTPAGDDHTVVLQAEVGARTARLDGLPPGRHYVSVTPCSGGRALVAAERRLPFEGVRNFRDLGGYPTADGRRVCWGKVFRSDALHNLTEADLESFKSLSVRLVYDFRNDIERARYPDPVGSEVLELVNLRPGEDSMRLGPGSTKADAERLLRDVYVGMLANSGPQFGQVLTGLADTGLLPTVFHCAGGKDRTGMMAALLLSALRVSRDAVLDDYELTARWRTVADEPELFRLLIAAGVPEEAATSLLGTPRWAMVEALAVLDEDYGGIDAYLRGPAGMNEESVAALRTTLTV